MDEQENEHVGEQVLWVWACTFKHVLFKYCTPTGCELEDLKECQWTGSQNDFQRWVFKLALKLFYSRISISTNRLIQTQYIHSLCSLQIGPCLRMLAVDPWMKSQKQKWFNQQYLNDSMESVHIQLLLQTAATRGISTWEAVSTGMLQ